MASTITAKDSASSNEKQPLGFFNLPAEVRLAIYDLAQPDDPILPRAGPLFPGLDGLVRANKKARAEILHRKLEHVTWRGRITSKTWRRFKTTLIPHITHLTMEVKSKNRRLAFTPKQFPTWSSLDIGCVREVRDLLTWIFWRNKSFLKAKCPWRLDNLTLVAIFEEHEWRVFGPPWGFERHNEHKPAHRAAMQGFRHWSEVREVKKLHDSGIHVEVARKRVR